MSKQDSWNEHSIPVGKGFRSNAPSLLPVPGSQVLSQPPLPSVATPQLPQAPHRPDLPRHCSPSSQEQVVQQQEEGEKSEPSRRHTWWGSPAAAAAARMFNRETAPRSCAGDTDTATFVDGADAASLRRQQQLEDRLWYAKRDLRRLRAQTERLTDELNEERDSKARLQKVCILRARHVPPSADGQVNAQECSDGIASGCVPCSTSGVCTAENTAQEGASGTSAVPHRPGAQERTFLSESYCRHLQRALRCLFCRCRTGRCTVMM